MTRRLHLLFSMILTITILTSSVSLSFAQQTRSQLNTYNDANITTNGQGRITGAIMNTMLGSLIDSMGVLTDSNVWEGSNAFTGATTFSGATTFLPGTAAANLNLAPFTTAQTQTYTTPPVYNFPGINLYVSQSGSNSNDCLSATETGGHGPCLTIAYTVQKAMNFDAGGFPITINIGTGSWFESIFINGPLRGSANRNLNPNTGGSGGYGYGPAELLFSGAGSTTILDGPYGPCGTLASSNNAVVGLRNLKIQNTQPDCGPTSYPSAIFTQLGGIINIHENVTFGPAGAEIMHAENPGSTIQIWNDYYITGSAGHFMAVSDHGEVLVSVGQGIISGSPTFSQGLMFARNLGEIQFNIAAPFTGSYTGPAFVFASNSVLEAPTANVTQFGGTSIPILYSGARFRGPAYATLFSTSGEGAGGVVTVSANSTPRTGTVTITAGAGAAANGTVNVRFPYYVGMNDGGIAPCMLTLLNNNVGASWTVGTVLFSFISHPAADYNLLRINWSNNATPLTNGTNYMFSYLCDGD